MSKEFYLHRDPAHNFARADVRADHRYLLAEVSCGYGCEADLALCLAALVQAGMIDVERLRAALVLAEPVAREKVEEIIIKDGRSC